MIGIGRGRSSRCACCRGSRRFGFFFFRLFFFRFFLGRSRAFGTFLDHGDQGADFDFVTFLGDQFGNRTGDRCVDFDGDLVGFKFDNRFIGCNCITDFFVPFRNCCFGNRLAQRGNFNFSRHFFLDRFFNQTVWACPNTNEF